MTTLTATDRCDRCGAQAYATATLNGTTLAFCGHHWRDHGDALHQAGAVIHDETAALTTPTADDTYRCER